MKKMLLRVGKWGLRLLLLVILLAVLDVTVLAFPYPLFPNKIEFENYALYSDGDLDSTYIEILKEARYRNESADISRQDHNYRVFLCKSHKLYSFFAFLCRKYPNSQGIGLTLLSNMYISEPRVAYMKTVSPPFRTYSFLDGSIAGVIAHEVGHMDTEASLGFRKYLSLPFWKSEGYAEYAANFGAASNDPEYSLKNRMALLYDDNFWNCRHSVAYRLYESQLMIEFLHTIKGCDFETIMKPEVTKEMILKDMYGWYRSE
jgi:hypothetical protein